MDFQLHQPPLKAAPQRMLAGLAEDLGLAYVDLLPRMQAAAGSDPEGFARAHFLDHTHYHPPGHAIVAKAVEPEVQAVLRR